MISFKNEQLLPETLWQLVASLMQRGESLRSAVEFLPKLYSKNQSIQKLSERLNQGESLSAIISSYGFEGQLGFYLGFMELPQAVATVTQRRNQQHIIKKKLIAKLTYPLFLMLFAMVVLYIFHEFLLPSMQGLLEHENETVKALTTALQIFRIISLFLLSLVGFSLIVGSLIVFNHRQVYFWMLLHKLGCDRIVRIYATYDLVSQLVILLSLGQSLNESLQIIRHHKSDPFASLLAFQLDEAMKQGQSLDNHLKPDLFDEEFFSLCQWSVASGELPSVLSSYQIICEQRFSQVISKGCRIIGFGCYLFVSGVIVLCYQIMMLPMELLNQL